MHIISSRVHTWIGLVVGVVLVAAPWILGFDDHAAPRAVAVGVGLFIIVNELVTTSPASPLKIVPMRIHVMTDVVTGLFLAASPWLLSFADLDVNAWVPHLVVGLLVAGYALVTDTSDETEAAGIDGKDRLRSR